MISAITLRLLKDANGSFRDVCCEYRCVFSEMDMHGFAAETSAYVTYIGRLGKAEAFRNPGERSSTPLAFAAELKLRPLLESGSQFGQYMSVGQLRTLAAAFVDLGSFAHGLHYTSALATRGALDSKFCERLLCAMARRAAHLVATVGKGIGAVPGASKQLRRIPHLADRLVRDVTTQGPPTRELLTAAICVAAETGNIRNLTRYEAALSSAGHERNETLDDALLRGFARAEGPEALQRAENVVVEAERRGEVRGDYYVRLVSRYARDVAMAVAACVCQGKTTSYNGNRGSNDSSGRRSDDRDSSDGASSERGESSGDNSGLWDQSEARDHESRSDENRGNERSNSIDGGDRMTCCCGRILQLNGHYAASRLVALYTRLITLARSSNVHSYGGGPQAHTISAPLSAWSFTSASAAIFHAATNAVADGRLHSAVIRTCGSLGDVDGMTKATTNLVQAGYTLNDNVCSAIVQCLIRAKRIQDVVDVLTIAVESGRVGLTGEAASAVLETMTIVRARSKEGKSGNDAGVGNKMREEFSEAESNGRNGREGTKGGPAEAERVGTAEVSKKRYWERAHCEMSVAAAFQQSFSHRGYLPLPHSRPPSCAIIINTCQTVQLFSCFADHQLLRAAARKAYPSISYHATAAFLSWRFRPCRRRGRSEHSLSSGSTRRSDRDCGWGVER